MSEFVEVPDSESVEEVDYGPKFEGLDSIEEEMREAASQLREKSSIYVVRVRERDDLDEVGLQVADLVANLRSRMPIEADFVFEKGPIPADKEAFNFTPVLGNGSGLEEDQVLSEGEICVIGRKLAEAMSASRDSESSIESRTVKLRAGDSLKYVTPENYKLPRRMKDVWALNISRQVLLEVLLGIAMIQSGNRIKVIDNYVDVSEKTDKRGQRS